MTSLGRGVTVLVLIGVCQAFLIQPDTRQEIQDLKDQLAALSKRLHRREIDNEFYQDEEEEVEEVEEVPVGCNLTASERMDCGFYGVTATSCRQRECCWQQTDEEDVPWCYHSKQTLRSTCNVNPDRRNECGQYGIRKAQCLAKNCCWRPSSEASAPWCFHEHVEPEPDSEECGVPARSPNLMSRIVGGVDSRPHSWPWQVSLQGDKEHFCGGSLVAPQWIVTAAHCAPGFEGKQASAVVGVHDLSSTTDRGRRVGINEIIPHEAYDKWTNSHDIMLLKLEEAVAYTDFLSPVCLPTGEEQFRAGRHCFITGWGTLTFQGSSPEELQQVMVPLVDTETCSHGFYEGNIDETMQCAGYEEGGKDSCQGDSGGPLVCFQDDRWVLVGVTSWGYGCAFDGYPGVYSNVTVLQSWVDQTIDEKS